jgi:hypothetical protein
VRSFRFNTPIAETHTPSLLLLLDADLDAPPLAAPQCPPPSNASGRAVWVGHPPQLLEEDVAVSPFADRDFRLLLLGQTTSQVGAQVSGIAIPLLAVLTLRPARSSSAWSRRPRRLRSP